MPILELDGVEKRFGGLPAVDGVTMEADDGEILAVVGPNGAGKSTLLKVIMGLEKGSAGTVTFLDAEITGLPPHLIRRRGIAMVGQTPRAFPSLTVLENVMVGAMFGISDGPQDEAAALEAAGEALEVVGLSHRRDDDVASLNLHERRFLELARAISGAPRLLLLDEIMAGLNDAELQSSVQMIRTVRDRLGMTVIWVEHVMKAVVALAERVLVLDFGKVLTEGRPEDVMRDQSVIDAYLGEGMGESAQGQ